MTTTATNPPTQNSNTSAIKVTVTNGQPSSSPARPTVAAIPTSLSRPIGSQVVNNVPPPPALSTPNVFALNQPSSTAQLASALEQQHSREVRLIEEMNQREKIKETRLIEALNQQEKNSYNECVRWWSCFRIAELKVVLGKFRISQYGRKQNLVDRLKFFYLENPLQRAELKKRVKEAYDLMNQPRTYSMGFGNSMYTPQSSSTNAHTPVMNTGNQGQNVAQEIKIPDEPMWERVKVVQQTMFGSHTFGNKGAMFYFQVELSPDVTAKLGNSSDPHKLMLSCVRAGPVGAIAPLQYPRYCQVVCNEHSYTSNASKSLAVDITSFVKGSDVSVKFNWSNDNQSYIAIAQLVRVNTPQQVIERIVSTKAWAKEKMLEHQFKKKVEADDLIAGPEIVSLRDPITRSRIKTPIKSQKCKHIQCFDGETYVLMNQTKPKWECPVCNSKIIFGELIFDGYFDDILKNTNEDCDSVQIMERGDWNVPKAKVAIETTESSSFNSNGKRDVIILDGTPEAARKRQKNEQIEIICISDSDDEPLLQGPSLIPGPSTSTAAFSPEELNRIFGGDSDEDDLPLNAVQTDVVLRGKGISLN